MGFIQKYNENICVPQCQNSYRYTYVKDNVSYCIHDCGEKGLDAKYRLYNTNKCVDTCSNNYSFVIYNEDVCLESCSEDNGYPYILEGNKCI